MPDFILKMKISWKNKRETTDSVITLNVYANNAFKTISTHDIEKLKIVKYSSLKWSILIL